MRKRLPEDHPDKSMVRNNIKISKNFLDKNGVSYTGLGDQQLSQACHIM